MGRVGLPGLLQMRTTNRVAENNRGLFLHTSGSWKSGVKVSVGLALPRDSEGRYGPCPSPCFLTTASVRAWLQKAPPLAHAFNTQAQIAHCYEDCGTFSRWDLAGESRPQGWTFAGLPLVLVWLSLLPVSYDVNKLTLPMSESGLLPTLISFPLPHCTGLKSV